MTFDELVAMLPKAPRITLTSTEPSVIYENEIPKRFVPPPLSLSAALTEAPKSPRVLIISAAGAVGKSMLARSLAAARCAPIWDLAKSGVVGVNSLQGALLNAMGLAGYATFSNAVAKGQALLVIDALDEGRVKTNEAGFEALISDISKFAVGTSLPSVVLLGRTQVSEFAWIVLETLGVSTALYSIDPFPREDAYRYIDLAISTSFRDAATRIEGYRTAYEGARGILFEQLARALSADDNSNAAAEQFFLGYAPVLDAIAVLLAKEQNFERLKQELLKYESQGVPTRSRGLLLVQHVIERILQREHEEKLAKLIQPALANDAHKYGWSSWERLYTPQEQCERLLRHILKLPIQPKGDLPPAISAAYEKQIATWLSEHPFLRDGVYFANVVFEGYLLSRGLAEDLAQARRPAEQYARSSVARPNRLLADFYFTRLPQNPLVPHEHLGILYDSFQAAETDQLHVRMTIDGVDPEDVEADSTNADATGEFEFLSSKNWGEGESTISVPLEFRLTLPPGATLLFSRYLRDVEIVVPCSVRLESHSEDIRIGPAVSIRAQKLELLARRLTVEKDTSGKAAIYANSSVLLDSESCEHLIAEVPTTYGELKVRWPGSSSYPWTQFSSVPDRSRKATPEQHEVYRRFRRIATTFRSHGRGRLARYKGKIEHRRVLKGQLGERLLEQLVADGVLTLEGRLYYWDDGQAEKHLGVSWSHLKAWQSPPALDAYLRTFLEKQKIWLKK
jgi:hypothetical protein